MYYSGSLQRSRCPSLEQRDLQTPALRRQRRRHRRPHASRSWERKAGLRPHDQQTAAEPEDLRPARGAGWEAAEAAAAARGAQAWLGRGKVNEITSGWKVLSALNATSCCNPRGRAALLRPDCSGASGPGSRGHPRPVPGTLLRALGATRGRASAWRGCSSPVSLSGSEGRPAPSCPAPQRR